ncbi:MAG: BNR-4 repeat-containing protein [Armatimonadaceae bacterium]
MAAGNQAAQAGREMVPPARQEVFCTKDDGYRGIWHGQTPTKDAYVYKYSGGLATYPYQHRPFAIYAPEVRKTFFCYGGAAKGFHTRPINQSFGANQLLHMVSYYDHATGTVPRPTLLLDKWCADAHDNPVLSIDRDGFLWIFSPSHGSGTTPSFVHRSTKPFSIERFETVETGLFAYPQPWYLPEHGFVMMHTIYDRGRTLRWRVSADGWRWSESHLLAKIAQGSYQVSGTDGRKVGTAFDYHPPQGGLEARTNLYYLETLDGGKTWRTVDGKPVSLPLTEVQNPALVRDYEAEGLKNYLKDLRFDRNGNPVILYTITKGWQPGPETGPREWYTARWTGREWVFHPAMQSWNNYDMGEFAIEPDGSWRFIAPTEPGPQPYNPGGEVALWVSKDEGRHWSNIRQLTRKSRYNHTFVRHPVNAHPDFFAFWADGDTHVPSEVRLYFANRDGTVVRRLPYIMSEDAATPEVVTDFS